MSEDLMHRAQIGIPDVDCGLNVGIVLWTHLDEKVTCPDCHAMKEAQTLWYEWLRKANEKTDDAGRPVELDKVGEARGFLAKHPNDAARIIAGYRWWR